ncbi:putative fasciclin-like arabinogalactan protein 1 [Forsythia ovata]|uniref:Fasciclin-like arabinogalactan protein 1 n=1 Tax=Forsythia ovata TaxID=205694 RepID=A0ABD1SPK0_9LAMI
MIHLIPTIEGRVHICRRPGGHCSFVLFFSTTTNAHNITHILAKFLEFSTFNHYLSKTHPMEDINWQETIIVCAVDNVGSTSKTLSISGIKNVLSIHVLLDYFDAKKLHRLPTALHLPPPCIRPSLTHVFKLVQLSHQIHMSPFTSNFAPNEHYIFSFQI